MTILHIIDSLAQGGAETLLLQTINELTMYNHILVYLNDTEDSLLDSFRNVKIYNLSLNNNLYILPRTLTLRRIIKQHHVEIVHAHLWKSVLLARLATPKSVRLLFTLHSMMSKDAFGSRIRLSIERLLYQRHQEVIAVSNTVLNDYAQYIKITGKKHIVYNFIDSKFFIPVLGKKNGDSFKMIAVGNLKKAKNYPFLIQALSKVKNLNFTLDIYGVGPQAELLQKFIDANQIPVKLMGKEKNIETVLPNYNLFIMASVYEGYGMALAEAMASGLPVLISDIPAFKEVAADAAFFFSLAHEGDLAIQLKAVHELHQQGTLVHWGNKCRKRAAEIASKEIFFRKLESIYCPS